MGVPQCSCVVYYCIAEYLIQTSIFQPNKMKVASLLVILGLGVVLVSARPQVNPGSQHDETLPPKDSKVCTHAAPSDCKQEDATLPPGGFYFDAQSKECKDYGMAFSCDGHENNFSTKEECIKTCLPQ